MNFENIKKGTLLTISDGTPEPPKHHTKKLAIWKTTNRTGYFYGYEPEYNNILLAYSPSLRGVINVISMKNLNISKTKV